MEPSQKNGPEPAVAPTAAAGPDPFDLGRTLRISGMIDWNAAEALITNLETLATVSNDPIRLVINSPGGLVACGLAIHDTILRLPVLVTTEIVGCGYSAGALIAQAGHRRLMTTHSALLLHEVTEEFNGSAGLSHLRRVVTENKARQGVIEGIFAERCKQPRRAIRSWCRDERAFGAQEALKMGLVDGIIPPAAVPEKSPTPPAKA
ncbi:ATP-dependent Clp protease proteolytic subunit [Candidatus Uhrbacteria bacterium]|nr:ATP-dependent Clp protease proteolytic subunit [Candidatus Uhrbacteria bacterium]